MLTTAWKRQCPQHALAVVEQQSEASQTEGLSLSLTTNAEARDEQSNATQLRAWFEPGSTMQHQTDESQAMSLTTQVQTSAQAKLHLARALVLFNLNNPDRYN